MRFLIKVSIPVEAGNKVIKARKIGETFKSILDDLRPEAVYFVEEGGKRTPYIVADIADPSHLPRVAEPFFLAFNAEVEFHPAMNAADLEKATPDIDKAVKKYG
jgi:hypothetical protein